MPSTYCPDLNGLWHVLGVTTAAKAVKPSIIVVAAEPGVVILFCNYRMLINYLQRQPMTHIDLNYVVKKWVSIHNCIERHN